LRYGMQNKKRKQSLGKILRECILHFLFNKRRGARYFDRNE
jgi:hypothetical protein